MLELTNLAIDRHGSRLVRALVGRCPPAATIGSAWGARSPPPPASPWSNRPARTATSTSSRSWSCAPRLSRCQEDHARRQPPRIPLRPMVCDHLGRGRRPGEPRRAPGRSSAPAADLYYSRRADRGPPCRDAFAGSATPTRRAASRPTSEPRRGATLRSISTASLCLPASIRSTSIQGITQAARELLPAEFGPASHSGPR